MHGRAGLPTASELRRWFDVSTAALGARYRTLGYIVGERVVIRRRLVSIVDEISRTSAFLGRFTPWSGSHPAVLEVVAAQETDGVGQWRLRFRPIDGFHALMCVPPLRRFSWRDNPSTE
jgi:hypothetical protein